MLLQRWLFFQIYLLHQGGFVFYSAVVVPIGTDQLDSALLQGLITQRVTWWLNLIGVTWLLFATWELFATSRTGHTTDRTRTLLLITKAFFALALIVLHHDMARWIDREDEIILDRAAFQTRHIVYLWLSTLDWLAGLLFAWLTLKHWGQNHPH